MSDLLIGALLGAVLTFAVLAYEIDRAWIILPASIIKH